MTAPGHAADAARPFADWRDFTPLADREPVVGVSAAACALLDDAVAYILTGEELLGCGLVPGDLLIVDRADRRPAPGALVVVYGAEYDPEPRDLPPSLVGLSPAVLARFRPMRAVPIVGQYWPQAGNAVIAIRGVLPGHPSPLGILDYALDEALVGVVAGTTPGARGARRRASTTRSTTGPAGTGARRWPASAGT